LSFYVVVTESVGPDKVRAVRAGQVLFHPQLRHPTLIVLHAPRPAHATCTGSCATV